MVDFGVSAIPMETFVVFAILGAERAMNIGELAMSKM